MRLTLPDPAVARDADLRRWRAAFGDTTPIADLAARQPGTCVGVVTRIRLVPDKALEVAISDGTGTLVATWQGRAQLPGVRLGSGLRLSGTVAEDPDGTRRMRNPAWAAVSGAYDRG